MKEQQELDVNAHVHGSVKTLSIDSLKLLTPAQVLEVIPCISEAQLTDSRASGVLLKKRAPAFVYLEGKAFYKSHTIAEWILSLDEAHSLNGNTFRFYKYSDTYREWEIGSCKKY